MFCGPALDTPAQLADVLRQAGVVVGHLERPEALVADVERLQRILRLALLALKMTDSHLGSFALAFALSRVAKSAKPGHTSPGIGTFPPVTLAVVAGVS